MNVVSEIYLPVYRYIARIKDVVATRPELPPLIQALSLLCIKWSDKAMSRALTAQDSVEAASPEASKFFVNNIRKLIEKICKISERDQKRLRPQDTAVITRSMQQLTVATSGLHRLYEGPGQGRHDNDFEDIKDISIEPTHQELLSEKVSHQMMNNKTISRPNQYLTFYAHRKAIFAGQYP